MFIDLNSAFSDFLARCLKSRRSVQIRAGVLEPRGRLRELPPRVLGGGGARGAFAGQLQQAQAGLQVLGGGRAAPAGHVWRRRATRRAGTRLASRACMRIHPARAASAELCGMHESVFLCRWSAHSSRGSSGRLRRNTRTPWKSPCLAARTQTMPRLAIGHRRSPTASLADPF